jgi:hypothetical protein
MPCEGGFNIMRKSHDLLEYLINKEMTSKTKRSLELLADFSLGYARGWHFCVPFFFHENLDIQFTGRTNNKIKTKLWTQGCCFNFSIGDMIHNHPYAYCENFECAPTILPLTIQVESSTPVIPQFLHKKKRIDRKRNPGMVNFKIFGLSQKESGQIYGSLSQDGFIKLLIQGFQPPP